MILHTVLYNNIIIQFYLTHDFFFCFILNSNLREEDTFYLFKSNYSYAVIYLSA